nr:hypothetical protein RNT25_01773 [arsenite-oxidising bacterium NT-25]
MDIINATNFKIEVRCPECSSSDVVMNGLSIIGWRVSVDKVTCRSCGFEQGGWRSASQPNPTRRHDMPMDKKHRGPWRPTTRLKMLVGAGLFCLAAWYGFYKLLF